MRLLNTSTIEFHEFHVDKIPPYAILSHTWGDGEMSFQDFRYGKGKDKDGYRKIIECCHLAASDHWEFVWIDTCCIDKTSSAELSEAINSMYEWYRKAAVCYAYLADVQSGDNNQKSTMMQFHGSRWFTRGWTLQELLAPEIVIFYDRNWKEIGTKSSLLEAISAITGIAESDMFHFNKANIAVKMSWASKRSTTRIEDTAYCLMGLFGVNMPLLYGEGGNAFIRLQLEILKMSDDETIFAWENANFKYIANFPLMDGTSGLLASSPDCFRHSGDVRQILFEKDRPVYLMTNKGLQMGLLLLEHTRPLSYPAKFWEKTYLASLNCTRDPEDRPLAIFLRSDLENKDIPNAFVRYTYGDLKLTTMSASDAGSILKIQRQTVYIRQHESIWKFKEGLRFSLTIKYPVSFRVTPMPSSSSSFLSDDSLQGREKLEYRKCDIELSRRGKGVLMFHRPYAKNPQSFVMILTVSHDSILTDVASPKGTQTLVETADLLDQQLRGLNRRYGKDRASTLLQDGSSVSVAVRPKGLSGRREKKFAVDVVIDESGHLPWAPSYKKDEPGQEQEATDAGIQTHDVTLHDNKRKLSASPISKVVKRKSRHPEGNLITCMRLKSPDH